jgi:hypothetical protein
VVPVVYRIYKYAKHGEDASSTIVLIMVSSQFWFPAAYGPFSGHSYRRQMVNMELQRREKAPCRLVVSGAARSILDISSALRAFCLMAPPQCGTLPSSQADIARYFAVAVLLGTWMLPHSRLLNPCASLPRRRRRVPGHRLLRGWR